MSKALDGLIHAYFSKPAERVEAALRGLDADPKCPTLISGVQSTDFSRVFL